MQHLPKLITASYGLRDKLEAMNRELPMRDRMDGWRIEYEAGFGVVRNAKTGAIYGKYTQVMNSKYKLVKE